MPGHDVFLSYHWRDHAAVQALASRLVSDGLRVFLDRWYLTPGTNWLTALETTLAECGAVAVCLGAEMGAWQQREVHAALERQTDAGRRGAAFPVIPVLLAGGAPPLGFLRQNTWVDLGRGVGDERALATLVRAIRGQPPGPDVIEHVERARDAVCPYRGLLVFREEDEPLFRGREAATQALVDAVDAHRVVVVVGASGSGKSSVVRAGLVPALRRRRDDAWEIVTIVPGDRPLYNLAAALLPLLEPEMGEVARLAEVQRLADGFASGAIALRDAAERVLARQPGTGRFLLVVDQWEELFTLTGTAEQRERFIAALLDATDASARRAPLHAVLTLRGDFFGRAITEHRALADRVQGAQVNVGPMTPDELRRAIVEPAEHAGLAFEPNLVELIVEHAERQPGHLPLLEFVLRELWERRQGRTLHRAAYDDIGQLDGAIARRAEAAFDRLAGRDHPAESRLHAIFVRLVRPGEGQHDTRRRARLDEFDGPSQTLIRDLADERLLVTSRADDGGAPTVEVAHEALIANWARLRDWVAADREFMVWRQRLQDKLDAWQQETRAPDDLLPRGVELAQAARWLRQRRTELSETERRFIETAAARRRRRNVVARSAAAAVSLSIAGTGAWALLERNRAEQARERAEQLVEFMVFELRDRLAPIGRLDLMDEVNRRVGEYYRVSGTGRSPEHQRRQGAALSNQGTIALEQGRLEAAREAFGQALAIFERLARAEPSNPQWQRDLSISHQRLGDVEVAAGRLEEARRAFQQDLEIAERLAASEPSDRQRQRDLSVSLNRLGEVEVAAGRTEAARRAFERDLSIVGRLAQADPSNAEWQRDLSVTFNKLGDVELTAGRLEDARQALERSLAIRRRLAQNDPSNTQWQRDLSVGFNKLGNVEIAGGRLAAARQAFEESLAIFERLAQGDPSNSQWQRDLSIGYQRLGDVEIADRAVDAARHAFERSLVIAERLAQADPSNSQRQRDLSISFHRLGDVETAVGRTPAARHAFEHALAIVERLVAADPSNSQWQRDLSVSLLKLGEVEAAAGRLDVARRVFERDLVIAEQLVRADPSNAEWQRDLSVSFEKLGDVETAAAKIDAARRAFERSLAIRERLAASDPSNSQWQRDLAIIHVRFAGMHKKAGRKADAVAALGAARTITARLVEQDPGNSVARSDLRWLDEQLVALGS